MTATRSVAFAACLVMVSSIALAQENLDFEEGTLDGWEAVGNAVKVTAEDSYTPPFEGSCMARIGDPFSEEGGMIGENVLRRTFQNIPVLRFSYNFFTYDYAPYDDPGLEVLVNGQVVLSVSAPPIEDVPGEGVPYSTGWQQCTVDLTPFGGGSGNFTVEFRAGNTEDRFLQSWVYIDNVVVAAAPTDFVMDYKTVRYGNTVALTARLADPAGPLAGRTIAFYVDKNSDTTFAPDELVGTAQTDASGQASLAYECWLKPANYSMQAVFGGDADHAGALTGQTLAVNQETSSMSFPAANGAQGQPVVFQATITHPRGPLPQVQVIFRVDINRDGWLPDNEIVGTGTTDVQGVARLSWPLQIPVGTYTTRADFLGNDYYQGVSRFSSLVVAAGPVIGPVDNLVKVALTAPALDRRTNMFRGLVTVTNVSTKSIQPPLLLYVRNLTPGVTVVDPDQIAPDGTPIVDISEAVPGGVLDPGESTSPFPLLFSNPQRLRIGLKISVYGVPSP